MTTWNHIANKHIDNLDHAAEVSKKLTSGNILIIADADSDLVPFMIYQDRTFAGVEETVKEVNCTHLYYELADGPAASYSLINQTPATAIAAALQGTRWTLGDIAPALANLTKDFDGILQNPLERLRQIEKEYQARLKFRVTMNGGSGGSGEGSGQGKTIGAFLVDLEEIEDTFSGKRFEFGRDLQGIDVQVDHSQIKTALIGTALGEEIDLATGDPLPLTFESVKWSKAAGDPADKPVGQNWVGNEESRELYGIFDPATGQMTHRFGIYESEAESPKTLLDATWLIGTRYHFQPRVTIEGRVADLEKVKILDIKTGKLATLSHEKVRLGQITYVVARDKGLLAAVDVKISRILRHIKAPELTTITWGDPILVGSDYVQEIGRRADWKERRRRKLDRGRGGQTVTVAHETTSSAPYYASFVVRDGEMLNDVFGDILSLLPANGGQIVFAEGTYPYDGSLLIDRDNVTIKGQGEGTRFVLKEGTAGDAYGFHADGRDNITIADFSMDGRKANQEGDIFASGVNFWHCNNVLIENVSVKDMKKSGIILAGVIDGRVANCSSSENGESGILIRDRSTTGKGCELVAAKNNRCWDNGTRGIAIHNSEEIEVLSNTLNDNNYNVYAENCESLTVTGNNTRWSTAHCMYFRDVHNSIISNNLCNETVFKGNIAVDGMAFYNCSKNTVSDNACGDNSGFGMRFTGSPGVRCSDNIISGNQCSGNSFDGIALWSADRCTITGNTCCDNDWNGLMLNTNPPTDAFTDNNVVQNNVCNNNNMYGIHISGDNNLVTNNDCQGNNWDGIVDWGTNTKLTAGNRT